MVLFFVFFGGREFVRVGRGDCATDPSSTHPSTRVRAWAPNPRTYLAGDEHVGAGGVEGGVVDGVGVRHAPELLLGLARVPQPHLFFFVLVFVVVRLGGSSVVKPARHVYTRVCCIQFTRAMSVNQSTTVGE